MSQSPLTEVKERFKDKDGLVAAVKKLASDDLFLDQLNEDKGLEHVSNTKLLHLHTVLSEVKEQFGSRKGLIEKILANEKREKDGDYRTGLEGQPTPRLYEQHRASAKRAAGAKA